MTTPDLLTPAEVAKIFRVDRKTITRWAASGLLAHIRTPGGTYRYLKSDIDALLVAEVTEPVKSPPPKVTPVPMPTPPPVEAWSGISWHGDDDL